jgi:peptide/nickel transport system ATP-binding protein
VRTAQYRRRAARLAPAPGRAPGEAPEAVLRVEELVVEFSQGRGRHLRAVDAISLDLRAGEIVGVVGESGSGKSTLGRTVAGFQRPTSGRVLLPGAGGELAERAGAHGYRDVQMIFQESAAALDPRVPVRRILREAFQPRPPVLPPRNRAAARARDAARVRDALHSVELPESFAGKRAAELSGGEKQRVAIARALAAAPALLVCDEAVAALDVAVRAITLNLLARLRRETSVALLFISHDISVVGHLADRIVVMHNGRVVESGSVNDILDNPQDQYTQRLIESVPKLELET